jgi:TPR repeat protein
MYERLADDGSVVSMLRLGWIFQRGLGRSVDLQGAEYWYLKALRAGQVRASVNLAHLYIESKKYWAASAILEDAVNNNYVRAMFILGVMKYEGLGCSVDFRCARHLWRKASSMGHLKSRVNLSKLYRRGVFGPLYIILGFILRIKTYPSWIAVLLRDSESDLIRG